MQSNAVERRRRVYEKKPEEEKENFFAVLCSSSSSSFFLSLSKFGNPINARKPPRRDGDSIHSCTHAHICRSIGRRDSQPCHFFPRCNRGLRTIRSPFSGCKKEKRIGSTRQWRRNAGRLSLSFIHVLIQQNKERSEIATHG